MLAQQGLLKALHESKPNNTEALDWEELQERVAVTVRLCLADEVFYHVMDKLYLKQKLYGLKI